MRYLEVQYNTQKHTKFYNKKYLVLNSSQFLFGLSFLLNNIKIEIFFLISYRLILSKIRTNIAMMEREQNDSIQYRMLITCSKFNLKKRKMKIMN